MSCMVVPPLEIRITVKRLNLTFHAVSDWRSTLLKYRRNFSLLTTNFDEILTRYGLRFRQSFKFA